MITSKELYHYYVAQDRLARGMHAPTLGQSLKQWIYMDPTWKFQRRLRKLEYQFNTKTTIFGTLYYYWLEYRYKKLSIALGFSIPKNACGPGLSLPHYGNIVINSRAKIGKNCKIHSGVNIGAAGGEPEAPIIGDNVYIGPGAKLYGNIIIGNNIAIAANACVGKSFIEENILIGGIPAKKIKSIDINRILKHIKFEN
ncbi:serine acetyltransferase [Arenibacter sp. GZD96]|uniref:hypothetical protein n=1 Tax=Aurantibrevibacter litoralis TaxID=3106030 RepID=UPI002AFDF175|nr:hypothetical protein [Arenibacter sp. GZD-96]MEA1787720.1 serine acetyltransferase [Arenibacter sp. GZD-96]